MHHSLTNAAEGIDHPPSYPCLCTMKRGENASKIAYEAPGLDLELAGISLNSEGIVAGDRQAGASARRTSCLAGVTAAATDAKVLDLPQPSTDPYGDATLLWRAFWPLRVCMGPHKAQGLRYCVLQRGGRRCTRWIDALMWRGSAVQCCGAVQDVEALREGLI